MHGDGKVPGSLEMAWRQMYGTSKSQAFDASSLLSHTMRLEYSIAVHGITILASEEKQFCRKAQLNRTRSKNSALEAVWGIHPLIAP